MPNKKDPREIAIDIIEKSLLGQDIQTALNKHLNSYELKKVDKSLITTICYGYLRFKKRIDFILKRSVKGSIKKLPFKLVIALGCGTYELLFLDKIPEYATVYWYVEYCKKNIAKRLSKLTNAVLRHISRIKDELLSERFYSDKDIKVFLSRYYSCPNWITDLWIKHFGIEKTTELLKRSISQPNIGIRINPKKMTHDVLDIFKTSSPIFYIEDLGFCFERTPSLPIEELEQKGMITRQSFESQKLMWDVLQNVWQEPVWDCCCGAGLKTTLLLERGIIDIFASDINFYRLSFLKKEIKRLELKDILVFKADATNFCPLKAPKTIVIDAPCSGLGVLSRRPDIKWKRYPKEIKRLKNIQKNILSNALKILNSSGRIVYITCTINPEENESLIREFAGVKIVKEICIDDFLKDPNLKEFFYTAVLEKI